MMDMASLCRVTLTLTVMLQLLIAVHHGNMPSSIRRAGYLNSAAAAASSPLSGTKIRQPWVRPPASTSDVQPAGHRYIPTFYDSVDDNQKLLTKLLDVGACTNTSDGKTFSYVPPLDGTNPNNMLCQQNYGMRFVLFDLQLVNIDTVDSISGSFTAQFQLVFHWREGWETLLNDTQWFAYTGDEIETANETSPCGFYCDSTLALETRCCDRMWVPPLQVPSCKVNDVQSVTPQPYLTTWYNETHKSYWDPNDDGYKHYSTRRMWYVGLDVTCPFTPDFHNFPFDYQFLTVDIINPYASRTWLQLNKGFLEANIVDTIAGINLSPDRKIGGWIIKDLIVSSACGTQQTWARTFLTQDYLLQILGDGYETQKDIIMAELKDIKCAEMKDIILESNISLSNPTTEQPYNHTRNDYMQLLEATLAKYKECIHTSRSTVEFKWKKIDGESNMPQEVKQFDLNDPANVNRSFSFIDFQYTEAPIDGIDFDCVIDAVANLTTPGIRINIILQRFRLYYFIKLILPTCACVGFSFAAFALDVDELLGRLTVVVPSAIALSTLQGYVVATDIPVVAYIAPTTYIILLSYAIQLLIALESTLLKLRRTWTFTTLKRLFAFFVRIFKWLFTPLVWIFRIFKRIIKSEKNLQTNKSLQMEICNAQLEVVHQRFHGKTKQDDSVQSLKFEETEDPNGQKKQGTSFSKQSEAQGQSSKDIPTDTSTSNDQATQERSFLHHLTSYIQTLQAWLSQDRDIPIDTSTSNGQATQERSFLHHLTSYIQKLQAWLSEETNIDSLCWKLLLLFYILGIILLTTIPLQMSKKRKERKLPSVYESLWS